MNELAGSEEQGWARAAPLLSMGQTMPFVAAIRGSDGAPYRYLSFLLALVK